MKPSDQAQWQGVVESWLAQGVVDNIATNPVAGALLSDCGQLAEGWYDFVIFLFADGDHYRGNVEHRNAANNATLYRWFVGWKAYDTISIEIPNWYIDTNERMRVTLTGDSDDVLGVTIQWTRKA